MNMFEKLKFFGPDRDLEISQIDQVEIEDMVVMQPELFEALKHLAYAKMTEQARKFIKAKPEDVTILQGKIQVIDDFIKTIANIKSYKIVKKEEEKPFIENGNTILKRMLGIKDDSVASPKQNKYTINDYLESKDFSEEVKNIKN